MKVPHGESPQLRKLAARAHVDQALENHAGPRYHGCVAAATGPNSNRYEPVRLFILLPGRSDSVAPGRASRERAVELPRGAVTAAGRADGNQLQTIKRWGERC